MLQKKTALVYSIQTQNCMKIYSAKL